MASSANQPQVSKLIGGLRAVYSSYKSTRNLLLLSRFVEDCVEKLSDEHGLLKVAENNTIIYVNELETAADPKGGKSDNDVRYVAFKVITQALGLNGYTNDFLKKWTAQEKANVVHPCLECLRTFDEELKALIEAERQCDSNLAAVEQEAEQESHRGGTSRPAYISTTYRQLTIPDVPSKGATFGLHKPVYTSPSSPTTGNTAAASAAGSSSSAPAATTPAALSSPVVTAGPATPTAQPVTTPTAFGSSSRAAAAWTAAEAFHAWDSWWDRNGNIANRKKELKQEDRARQHNEWRRQHHLPGPDRTWAGIEQHVKFLKERSNLPSVQDVYGKLKIDSGN